MMWTRALLLLWILSVVPASAWSEPAAPEERPADSQEQAGSHGWLGTGTSTAAGEVKSRLDKIPKYRARDFDRIRYGNHSARKQLAVKANRLVDTLRQSPGAKVLAPGAYVAGSLARATGHLCEGDARGAAVALTDSTSQGLTAAGGAAVGAKVFAAVGLSVGGPIGGVIGGAVGGVCGGVAAALGYDAYLSPVVTGAAEAALPEAEVDYVEKARETRRDFFIDKAKEAARVREASLLSEYGMTRVPTDELLLERDIRDLLPPEALSPARLIPETCTVRTWNSEGNYPMILHIRDNHVTAKTGESLPAGTPAGTFTGTMSEDGRVMKGSWRMSDGSSSTETWRFQSDNRVHLSITWYHTTPKPSSSQGTLTISWHLVGKD
ncbi:MAG: hypothetical protein RBS80_22325 [Thermoguttaceae bacterium]|jgi:hypothetical protein|nr:hypothetical protein [Thermoguttaceae bacterium]